MMPYNLIPSQLRKPSEPLPILMFQLLNVLVPWRILKLLKFGLINGIDPVTFAKFMQRDKARKPQHDGQRRRCTDGGGYCRYGMMKNLDSWNWLLKWLVLLLL